MVNPVSQFHTCISYIEAGNRRDTKGILESLCLSTNSSLDCIRSELREIISQVETQEISRLKESVASIWQKWFSQPSAASPKRPALDASFVPFFWKQTSAFAEFESLRNNPLLPVRFVNLDISALGSDRDFNPALDRWLKKIVESAEYGTSISLTLSRVFTCLEAALINEEFCLYFKETLMHTLDLTCTDGAILGLHGLEIELLLIRNSDRSLPELINLLNGVYITYLLQEFAVKYSKRTKADSAEVHLHLQIYFKDEFSLPIQSSQMKFVSGLEEKNFQTARLIIRDGLENIERKIQFFMSFEQWKTKLNFEKSGLFARIQTEFFKRMDSLEARKERLSSMAYKEASNQLMKEYNVALERFYLDITRSLLKTQLPTRIISLKRKQ